MTQLHCHKCDIASSSSSYYIDSADDVAHKTQMHVQENIVLII